MLIVGFQTQYLTHRSVESLHLNQAEWYSSQSARLTYHTGDLVEHIDTEAHTILTSEVSNVVFRLPLRTQTIIIQGLHFPYDICVVATGSNAALPPYVSPARAQLTQGVFVYRTIADLDRMIVFTNAKQVNRVTVIGGGLLGLEAAKALLDLGTVPQVALIERNEWVCDFPPGRTCF
jgi:nitrite reductase (NAD(P)H)